MNVSPVPVQWNTTTNTNTYPNTYPYPNTNTNTYTYTDNVNVSPIPVQWNTTTTTPTTYTNNNTWVSPIVTNPTYSGQTSGIIFTTPNTTTTGGSTSTSTSTSTSSTTPLTNNAQWLTNPNIAKIDTYLRTNDRNLGGNNAVLLNVAQSADGQYSLFYGTGTDKYY